MGQRGFRRHAAGNNVSGGRSLGDTALARPAGIFWAAGDNHAELGGDDIQSFTHIFADHMAHGSAGAGRLGFDNHLHTLQMLGQ